MLPDVIRLSVWRHVTSYLQNCDLWILFKIFRKYTQELCNASYKKEGIILFDILHLYTKFQSHRYNIFFFLTDLVPLRTHMKFFSLPACSAWITKPWGVGLIRKLIWSYGGLYINSQSNIVNDETNIVNDELNIVNDETNIVYDESNIVYDQSNIVNY